MVHLTRRSRCTLVLIALVLLIPVVGMRLQPRSILEQFHNRQLAPPPSRALIATDPARYFKERKSWLADRAYPIIETTYWHKWTLYTVFSTAPEPRVTLGRNHFVFLNGGSNAGVNELFESACIQSHAPEKAALLDHEIEALASTRSGPPSIEAVIIPTLATVYPENLPPSVPARFRNACQRVAEGLSPLQGVANRHPRVLTYPLPAMRTGRTDPGFYPRANWHALGLSLITVRDEYLRRLGYLQRPADEKVVLAQTHSEILSTYRLATTQPQYLVSNPNVNRDAEYERLLARPILAAGGQSSDIMVYKNSRPVIPQTMLMLSDSFGIASAPIFAGAYTMVIQVNTNNMNNRQIDRLVSEIAALHPVDRIVLLAQEGNVPRVIDWLWAINHSAALPRADVSQGLSSSEPRAQEKLQP